MKLAIVCGISEYQFQSKLDACKNDSETLKNFLTATGAYTDICHLESSTTGLVAKKIISEFIQKHRGGAIEELLFYFSGHGDRTEDDFFYAFSDFKSDRRETSGLRNTELDSLIRNLAPALTVKIVDACYSGSTYIKSEDDISPVIQKSATDNQIKKLYFLHSSAADQTSLAGPQFSLFTYALFQFLVTQSGPVRYRDIIAAVADEISRSGGPRPTFVVQADSLEVFVQMEHSLSELLRASLGISLPSMPSPGSKDSEEVLESELKIDTHARSSEKMSLAKLAAIKASETYCTREEAEESIQLMTALLNIETWPQQIIDAYEIQSRTLEHNDVPNKVAIAKWIISLKDDSVFAAPLYETQTYKVEEYREVPTKPDRTEIYGIGSIPSMRRLLGADKDYKLETVEKKKQVISGFKYTVDSKFEPHLLHFVPKLSSLEQYAACIVCLFSRRMLTCLYSIEHLPYKGWNVASPATAPQWKQQSAALKNPEKIKDLIKAVVAEVSDFIESDARQRLI